MSPGGETIVRDRFYSFLIWQTIQSVVIYILSKFFILSPFFFTPSLSGSLVFLAFVLALLLFSASLSAVASPQPDRAASPFELALALVRLLFVSGSHTPSLGFRRRALISLRFLLFLAASAMSGFMAVVSVCWSSDAFTGSRIEMGTVGFRGLTVGLFYGLHYLCHTRWVLQFPIIQRPPFFSFKMGIPSAIEQALKLSSAGYIISALPVIFLPNDHEGSLTLGKFIAEQMVFYIGTFMVSLCWELSHHLHQVLHTKRVNFAPPKGSAAAETNPSEPLLAALEESTPRTLFQYLAYLDLCMVCQSNVDTWRRAAFYEETGETYKRVLAVCLRPLDQFTVKLGEVLENCSDDNSFQLSHQLRSPREGLAHSRFYEPFYDFQLCAWCAQIVAALTVRSRNDDRYGVAQLFGCNAVVMSTLISSLLAVETYMGKKTNLHSRQHYLMGPASIKWAVLSNGRRDATAGIAGKRKGSPMYSKAYAMADILRTSIYCIVSAFHDNMVNSAKSGRLPEKDWIITSKPIYGTPEQLLQTYLLFLDFRA